MRKMAFHLLIALTASVSWLSAQAQQSALHPATPKAGQIIVYRIWKFAGGGRSIPIRLDNNPRIKLENGYYYTFVVSAGDHSLIRQGDFGKDPITIHVESNQTVYVDAHYGAWPTIFERAEDQAEARARVSRPKAQTSSR